MDSVTHLEQMDVSSLVNNILESIHGDKFWDILEELVVNVVNKRLVITDGTSIDRQIDNRYTMVLIDILKMVIVHMLIISMLDG